jgi:flagellar hook-length control protein FliK
MPIDVKTDAPIEKAGQTQDEATPVLVSELPNRELDFDQVNVKVGETYNLYGNDFDEQLTDKILHKVDLNVQEFDIQLYPKELGEVHINVVFDSGKAVVSLICANEKAQQLLNAHAGDIRTIIETHTGNQTVVDVQKSERDMYQQQNPDGQSRGRQAQQQQPQHSADEVDIFIDQLKMGMRVTA